MTRGFPVVGSRVLGTIAGMVLLATPLRAQQPPPPAGRCVLEVSGNSPATHLTSVKLPSGQYNNFLGGGVTGRCPAQSLTLVADSAEYFGDLRVWHLVGNVHYNEPRIIMDSQVATYYLNEERLLSEGDVHALLPSGTTLVGPRVEYWRAIANTRPRARMVAPGRPTIQVITKDSTGKPSEPMQVVANTVTMDGDSLVYASGKVEITRSDVFATGDSAAMDSGRQFARLLLRPSITSRGKRPFTLYGTVIDLFGQNRALERVFSQGNAKSVSQDATLTADTLDFRMARGFLQRVFGWGASRSHAVNPQYDVVADSLDVMMPDQRLREVRAVRKAFAQSVPDSTRLHTTERDWLRGDTIVAHFDTTGVGDTTKQPPIRQLVALGHASSFYHIATKDTTALGPAINYVKGRDITIAFVDKQVRRVTVLDQAAGLYLEPGVANDSTKQKARTTTTAPAPNPRPRRP